MAFSFDDLTPAARRAAFAHMGAKGKLGSGGRHKKLSAKKKAAVEDHGRGRVSGKLGSGSVKGKLTPADHDNGSVGGKLPIAKARPSAPKPAAKPSAPAKPTADTPEGRFDEHFTGFMKKLTMSRHSSYAGMVEVRKELDAKGLSRAEQDAHLKRMSREGKIHIVPEDNRKAMRQEDHDAAIHIGGEPNDLVQLSSAGADDFAKLRDKAPTQSTDPKKLAEARTPEDFKTLAENYLQMHGSDGVAFRIKTLEKRQKLSPGQRAQLAALKSLGKK